MKQQWIDYRIQWKPTGHQSGAMRGLSAGIGDHLRALALLRDYPDPRRLDLRASLRDPFERLFVRDTYLNTALKLIVLVDATASMGYVGAVNRWQVAQEIAAQLALSAYRSGDAFGLYVANQALIREGTLPPRLNRSAWLWIQQHLHRVKPQGNRMDGLIKVTSQLPRKRSLVFLVSDFRWSESDTNMMFKKLNHHDVIPIVLEDPFEVSQAPKQGMAILQDAETGQSKFVWMRAGLIQSLQNKRLQHTQMLHQLSRRYGYKPFLVHGSFNPMALTHYFMERQT
ncbi:MAG: hypothetical protein Q8R74_13505 [Methylophilus sp.]|nr:hypothetical protein [Methylophilus sp.]MDP3610084.1 hypothetical protein [Methylophilus sp.]